MVLSDGEGRGSERKTTKKKRDREVAEDDILITDSGRVPLYKSFQSFLTLSLSLPLYFSLCENEPTNSRIFKSLSPCVFYFDSLLPLSKCFSFSIHGVLNY